MGIDDVVRTRMASTTTGRCRHKLGVVMDMHNRLLFGGMAIQTMNRGAWSGYSIVNHHGNRDTSSSRDIHVSG